MKHIKKASPNRKGDFAEYYAVTWLWDKGYEVFRNCGCDGLIDLVARDKKNNIIFIDVKTGAKQNLTNTEWKDNKTKWNKRTQEQKKLGVKVLLFNPDTRALNFVEHRE